MKYRFLLLIFLVITFLTVVAFQFYESTIIQKLSPYFPSSDENSPGYYSDLITFLFSEAIWIAVLLLLTLYFARFGNLLENVSRVELYLSRNRWMTRALILFSFVMITVVVATVGLEQFPNSADEFVYLFQAEQLSDGKFWDEVHPVPDFFEFHHLAQKDGKWVGRFPPGWPLLLSIAYVLHIPPFLINMLLGFLAAVLMFKLASRLYDERIALWSTIAMVFSSFFIFNAATFFSHVASLLQGLLFVYCAYRFLQTQRKIYVLAAGIFMGTLIMTRQLTALIFLVPFVIYYFYQLKWRAVFPLILMAIATLPFVGFFLWYNYKITGDPFVPVTMWTNADEALGFVKGHTPIKGAKFTFKRLAMFLYWASPSLLILYFVFVFMRLKEYKKILSHPEDYLFILMIIGYFFYYHSGGNQYGPRFYLEGYPFLIIFVIAKVLRTNYRWAKVFLFLGIVFNLVKIPFITLREHSVIKERKDVYTAVAESGISNAVVFISSPTGIIRPMPIEDLNRNDRFYKNDVIYARDLGDENQKLMDYYKGRNFYLYKREEDIVTGELIKLESRNTPGVAMTNE
jgi:hypothetical protein